ncbi:sulfide:quinone oxidoreductase, mitochondrial-like [Saccoglossus kowalevskii]|uniref:Sulfide:quinone oxidoreductase, mitochondrial-like n=1 Tax=Saccoglossus kowalevskii TaxID=10224 RepID=A0ABM0LZM9_SACKO|nr:PREDICTED: sulfide:quinone oxidoreductase, mitochondrial-like [Saccoglossus kowalevskii]
MACVKLLQRSGSSVHGMARACTAPSMHFSTTPCAKAKKNYEVVIVGGGAGGCAMASKIGRRLGKGKVAVVEPHETHYYQPYWTLVGAGLKKIENSCKPSSEVISNKADWLKDKVQEFQPENNLILTKNGDEIKYEYLIVAVGLTLHYDWLDNAAFWTKQSSQSCKERNRNNW